MKEDVINNLLKDLILQHPNHSKEWLLEAIRFGGGNKVKIEQYLKDKSIKYLLRR